MWSDGWLHQELSKRASWACSVRDRSVATATREGISHSSYSTIYHLTIRIRYTIYIIYILPEGNERFSRYTSHNLIYIFVHVYFLLISSFVPRRKEIGPVLEGYLVFLLLSSVLIYFPFLLLSSQKGPLIVECTGFSPYTYQRVLTDANVPCYTDDWCLCRETTRSQREMTEGDVQGGNV